MFKNETISIKINKRTEKHYKELGYDVKINDYNLVKIKDLTKGNRVLLDVICDGCGKEYKAVYKNVHKSKNHVCTKYCESEAKKNKFKNKFIEKYGEESLEKMIYMYVVEMKTTRMIAKEILGSDINHSTINGWLKRLGVELRQGSEAIKTQWINAEERKKKTSELAKINLYFEKENHPNWKKELTQEQRERKRNTLEDRKWYKEVLRVNDNECIKCKSDDNLHVHHIMPYSKNKNLRYNVDNGAIICGSCHKNFHKINGFEYQLSDWYDFVNS